MKGGRPGAPAQTEDVDLGRIVNNRSDVHRRGPSTDGERPACDRDF